MMRLSTNTLLLFVALTLITRSPAAAEFLGHPDLSKKSESLKHIVLLPPQIDLFEIGAGGTLERMEEWSQAARANTRTAIQGEFAKREHLAYLELDERNLSGATRANYDETLLLYATASNAILAHAFPPPNARSAQRSMFFPWKAREFTYSLGEETTSLAANADAFLLIRGIDQRSSGGRKALGIGTAIIGVALGVVPVPQGGLNLFTAALIDARTGDILWFSKSIMPYDLRDPSDATKLILEFMTDFPTIGPLPKPQ